MTSTKPPRWGAAIPARALAVLATLLAVVVFACSPTGSSSGTPGPTPTLPFGTGETPRPTVWPTLVVESAIALGAADGDFAAMSNDISAALEEADPEALLTVIDRALEFLTENEKNIPRLQGYDHTKDVGDRLASAYALMIEGATQIRTGLVSGDGDAVEAGFGTFIEGNTAYQAVRSELGDLADQAVFMKRLLLR